MPKNDDVLLDLSEWTKEGGRRTTLPPRPTTRRRRGLPGGLSGRGVMTAVGVLGLALLVVPLPGTGCGSPLAVWRDAPVAVPSDEDPALDDAQVAADAEAVRRAQLALAAPAPVATRPVVRTTPVPVTRTVVRPGSSAAAARVPALEDAVAQDQRDVDEAKQARDDVVEQQQASDDPNAYDAEVAAAQEELDAALARLEGDRRALEKARREARSTTVTVATTSPSPVSAPASAAVSSGAAAAPTQEERVEALAAARRVQAEHLAERKQALADWTASHAAEVRAAEAANSALRSCEGTVRVPAALGVLALVAAGGAAVRSRLGR